LSIWRGAGHIEATFLAVLLRRPPHRLPGRAE
jgi:hypothetical protein